MAYTFLDRGLNPMGVLTNKGGQTNNYWGDQITHSIATGNDVLTSVSLSIDKETTNIDTSGNQKEWNHTIQGLSFGIDGIGREVNELNYLMYKDGEMGRNYLMTITQVDESLTQSGFHFKTIQGINAAAYDLSRKTLRAKDFGIVATGSVTQGTAQNILGYIFDGLGWDIRIIGSFPSIDYSVQDGVTAQSVLQDIIKLFDSSVDAYVLINNLSNGSNVFTGGGSIKRVFDFSTDIGHDEGQTIRLNKNLVSLTKTGARDSMYTKLFVSGNGITIGPANNGSDYIVDDDANKEYNVLGANSVPVQYLEGAISNSAISDPKALLTWGKKQLAALNHPRFNYVVSSVDGKNVHLGDTVVIQDLKASQPIMLKSKIISKTLSFSDPQTDSFIVGEFSPIVITSKTGNTDDIIEMVNQASSGIFTTISATNLIVDSSLLNQLDNWVISEGDKKWYYDGHTQYKGVSSIGINVTDGNYNLISSQNISENTFAGSTLYVSVDVLARSIGSTSNDYLEVYLHERDNNNTETATTNITGRLSESNNEWTNYRSKIELNSSTRYVFLEYRTHGTANVYVSRPYVGVIDIPNEAYVPGANNNNGTVLTLLKDNWKIGIADNSGALISGINGDTSGTVIAGNKIILDGKVTVTDDFNASKIITQGLATTNATIEKKLTMGKYGKITASYDKSGHFPTLTNLDFQYILYGGYTFTSDGILLSGGARRNSEISNSPVISVGNTGYILDTWDSSLSIAESNIKISATNTKGYAVNSSVSPSLTNVPDATIDINPYFITVKAESNQTTISSTGITSKSINASKNLWSGGDFTVTQDINLGWSLIKNGVGIYPSIFNGLPGIRISGTDAGIVFDSNAGFIYGIAGNKWYRLSSSADGTGSWVN